jgi:hypothetical protein
VVTPEPLGESRALFNGTLRQIQSDIATCRDLGVAEVIVDVNVGDGDQPLSQMLGGMELMYAIALDAIQPKTLAAAGM